MIIDVAVNSGFSGCQHKFVIAPESCRGGITCSEVGDLLLHPELSVHVCVLCETHRFAFAEGRHGFCMLMLKLAASEYDTQVACILPLQPTAVHFWKCHAGRPWSWVS